MKNEDSNISSFTLSFNSRTIEFVFPFEAWLVHALWHVLTKIMNNTIIDISY